MIPREQLSANWNHVQERIRNAATRVGRPFDEIMLVAVTKTVPASTVRMLFDFGQCNLGESRVQEALPKLDEVGAGPIWHLIGHLQSNKVHKVVGRFAWIHSVDSVELLDRLHRVVENTSAPPPRICLQVNVTGETTKSGLDPDAVKAALARASSLGGIQVEGLMTMAPFSQDPETARPAFRALRQLRDDAERESWYRQPLRHLSMGMSDDLEVAVEEGATLVRVGSALFAPEDP